jgi:predicted RNA-binding protein with PUA-like domain
MSWWLIKSEPHVYAFTQLVKDGQTSWQGVRNYEARNNLRAMKKGDLALYYHSNEGKEIVGIARIKRAAYADATAPKGEDWVTVDVEPVKALATPVSLATIKQSAKLNKMALVKKARISVVPVTDAERREVLKLGNTDLTERRKH